MNRSRFPALKASLSRLHLFQHWGVPPAEADATWPRTDRRIADRRMTQRRTNERRRYISDFRHRELRLRAAAQVTGTGVYDFDFATRTNYWSPELKAMAGLPEDPGDINLEQMTQVVHPEDGERFVQKLEASLDPGGDGHLEDEFRLVRPDGALRWVRVRGRTFFAGEGPERRVLGASGLVSDITEEKRVEEELREFKFFSDHANDGQYVADSEGRIRYANRQFCESLGYSEEELLRLRVRDFAPHATPEFFWHLVESTKGGRLLPYESIRQRKDGSTLPVELSATALEVDGEWLIFTVSRDITERKATEQALKDSERRLALALEASGSAVWETDLAQGIVRGDDQLFISLGYAPGELTTSAEWLALVHEEDQAAASEKYDEVIQGKRERCRMEIRVRAKDGSWRWRVVHAVAAERNEAGRALRLVGTYTDITERREMEDALRRDRSRLQGILDNAPMLISIKSLEGRMALANRAYYELLDVPPPEQFIGRSIFEVFPKEVANRLWADDQQALATNGPIRAEEILRHRDGGWHTYLSIRFPVRDIQTGRPKSLCSIALDITDRKAAEAQVRALNVVLEGRVQERTAQLHESNEALLHSNTELKHFAHVTAHDLQTPLRSIVGFTQLLQKEVQGRVNERVDEWSAAIVDNTRRLQTLIQEILSYTRLEVQGLPFETTDLRTLLDQVVASLAGLIGETRADVTCSAVPTLPVDRTQIAQVFQNLIENGIKYNRSEPPRIAVSAELQDDQWVFSVADNGIGIDPKHHDRIFELFQRLHAYHQVPGTGIGLALCRRIVERHGGHMWLDSRPGEGSTFYFSLPVPVGINEAT